MKNLCAPLSLAAALGSLLISTQPALAQGSLAPPGAPAPTMKTLTQIQPRTPLATNTTPGDGEDVFIISQPGSYYLTTNIVAGDLNGIEILANNVTLNFEGFTVQGMLEGGYGIYIPNIQTNITVRNGIISGGYTGVYSASASSVGLLFECVNVSGCNYGMIVNGSGVARSCNAVGNIGSGIELLGDAIVSGCTVNNNGLGISCYYGIVSGCTVNNNRGQGIYVVFGGTVTGCEVGSNVGGIYMSGPGTVSGCASLTNGGDGIAVFSGIVSGCLVDASEASGIYVEGPGSAVIGNTCIGNNVGNGANTAGIYIVASNNRIEDNHVTATLGAGIQVASGLTNNVIIKNSVIGNGANNYIVPAGNDLGPVGTATNSTSPWANISH